MHSNLWTKVHEILEKCRGPLVVANAIFLVVCIVFNSIGNHHCREFVKKHPEVGSFGASHLKVWEHSRFWMHIDKSG